MIKYVVGQRIMTSLIDQDQAAVGDIRDIREWGWERPKARYKVTRVEGRMIYGEIVEVAGV